MSDVSSESIVAAFEDLGLDLDEPKVVDLLSALCSIYKVDVDKMSTEVMAFMYGKKLSVTSSPTVELLVQYENEVLKNMGEKKARDANRRIVDVTNLLCENDNDVDDLTLSSYNLKTTPKRNDASAKRQFTDGSGADRKRMLTAGGGMFSPASCGNVDDVAATSTPNSRKYQARKNAGSTMISFGDGGAASDWKVAKHEFTASVKAFNEDKALKEPYRFMFEGLRDKAGFLDESICRTGEAIAAKYQLDEAEDFTHTLPDSFVCLGRVCCDSPDGRLNAHSILLQGTQDLCNGKSLPFEPSRVPEYSLFPGQIIMAMAVNPNGTRLLASNIYADASLPLPQLRDRIKDFPLSVVVASGPYTASDDLSYEPLSDFLKYVVNNKPHVVVLTGPFVDEKHQMIESGDLQETFEQVHGRVMRMVAEMAKELPTTQVVIVSSSHDVNHISIFPTPPFPSVISGSAVPENVRMVSDPCMLNVEGVVFGMTSTDVLMHLGKEEISAPRSGDRLRRLANHLLQQRSMYPLYPPSEVLNLDIENLENHAQLTVQPHVLILPSDLLHFFKDINGGLVVNPSRLTKREGGGVFARFVIRPAKTDEEPFSKRVRGEIVRI